MSEEKNVFEQEGLYVGVGQEGDDVKVVWRGVSETQDPELGIGPFLRDLLVRLEGKRVVMDFRELQYMNSATIQSLFQMVKALSSRGIETSLYYDIRSEWQRITFRSIKTVVQTLSHIQIVEA